MENCATSFLFYLYLTLYTCFQRIGAMFFGKKLEELNRSYLISYTVGTLKGLVKLFVLIAG